MEKPFSPNQLTGPESTELAESRSFVLQELAHLNKQVDAVSPQSQMAFAELAYALHKMCGEIIRDDDTYTQLPAQNRQRVEAYQRRVLYQTNNELRWQVFETQVDAYGQRTGLIRLSVHGLLILLRIYPGVSPADGPAGFMPDAICLCELDKLAIDWLATVQARRTAATKHYSK